MIKQLFFFVIILFSLFLIPSTVVAEEGVLWDNRKVLYTHGTVFTNNDQIDYQKLDTLYFYGLDTLILLNHKWDLALLEEQIANIKNNPVLNKFKYVYSMINFLHAFHEECVIDPICDINTYVPTEYLDNYVDFIKNNSDVFIGYYTFDEPMVHSINKTYQENVYSYIRSLDPDSQHRPVIFADTMWEATENKINNFLSLDSYDILFIDQYSDDLAMQTEYYQKWQNYGFLTKPFYKILPAFKKTDGCEAVDLIDNADINESAIQSVGGSDALFNLKGVGYFSFWLLETMDNDWKEDMRNCDEIFNSTLESLRNERAKEREAFFSFNPEQADWYNDQFESIEYGDTSSQSKGFAQPIQNQILEGGGIVYNGIQAHVPFRDNSYVRGDFGYYHLPLDKPLYFTSQVGLNNFSSCGDGVEFRVKVIRYDDNYEKIGEQVIGSPLILARNSGKKSILISLIDRLGDIVKISLVTKSIISPDCDNVSWELPKVVDLSFVEPSPSPSPSSNPADLNEDGRVDGFDLKQLLAKLYNAIFEQEDINQDGKINLLDAALIFKNWTE